MREGEGEREGEKARALVPLHVLEQGSNRFSERGGGRGVGGGEGG